MKPHLNYCPCASTLSYEMCCRPLHQKKVPARSARDLMRSRYAAYALGLADYIVDTTHPENPAYNKNRKAWLKDIMLFCRQSKFEGLKVWEESESETKASVSFTAHLRQGARDASFSEKSYFEKVEGRWLYKSGEIQKFLL